MGTPADTAIVEAAREAAESVIYGRIDRSDIRDLDVTISYEEEILEVDIYIDAPDTTVDIQQVADDAALAAQAAVDELHGE